MKVFVNNQLFDTGETPVVLIFTGDEERVWVAEQLMNFAPKYREPRYYAMFPETIDGEELLLKAVQANKGIKQTENGKNEDKA